MTTKNDDLNIAEYFALVLGKVMSKPIPNVDRWDELDDDEWSLDSHCGEAARLMIDKMGDLLGAMSEVDNKMAIIHAVQNDIMVICFG
jgi:hypothetical protein